jgi:hypothetical protein
MEFMAISNKKRLENFAPCYWRIFEENHTGMEFMAISNKKRLENFAPCYWRIFEENHTLFWF